MRYKNLFLLFFVMLLTFCIVGCLGVGSINKSTTNKSTINSIGDCPVLKALNTNAESTVNQIAVSGDKWSGTVDLNEQGAISDSCNGDTDNDIQSCIYFLSAVCII